MKWEKNSIKWVPEISRESEYYGGKIQIIFFNLEFIWKAAKSHTLFNLMMQLRTHVNETIVNRWTDRFSNNFRKKIGIIQKKVLLSVCLYRKSNTSLSHLTIG